MESDTMQNTFRNVRQAQQDEDDLLTDAVSIFEQMKVLNHSRGAGLEALAQKHEEEIEALKDTHRREIEWVIEFRKNELANKDREHREEMEALRARHESPSSDQFDYSIRNVKLALALAHETQMDMITGMLQSLEFRKKANKTIIDLCSQLILEADWIQNNPNLFEELKTARYPFSDAKFVQTLKDDTKRRLELVQEGIESVNTKRDKQMSRNKTVLKNVIGALMHLAAVANIKLKLSLDSLLGSDNKEE